MAQPLSENRTVSRDLTYVRLFPAMVNPVADVIEAQALDCWRLHPAGGFPGAGLGAVFYRTFSAEEDT
jgi:hypothetical protein